jgi:peptidoglycan/xylan/chitin deacetylase (PgdA/CDA1 family)
MNLGKFLEKAVVKSFKKIPVSLLQKATDANILIPYYHMVSDRDLPHVKHLYEYKNVKSVVDDLDFLGKKYSSITLQDLLDSLYRGRKLPGNAMLLTFDDGFREMHDVVAPLLLKKGIHATFFVNTDFIDNHDMCYLNKASILADVLDKTYNSEIIEEIEGLLPFGKNENGKLKDLLLTIPYENRNVLDEIAEVLGIDFKKYLEDHRPYLTSGHIRKMIDHGFTFGAHSLDHPVYSSLPVNEQVKQTVESVSALRSRFSIKYGAFSFPHHDKNVTKSFFDEIFKGGMVDVTFGIDGFLNDSVKYNLQRVNLERTLMPADYIIAKKYAQKIYFTIAGKANIERV